VPTGRALPSGRTTCCARHERRSGQYSCSVINVSSGQRRSLPGADIICCASERFCRLRAYIPEDQACNTNLSIMDSAGFVQRLHRASGDTALLGEQRVGDRTPAGTAGAWPTLPARCMAGP